MEKSKISENFNALKLLSQESIEKVFEDFNSDKNGLKLNQIFALRKKYGYNELKVDNEKGLIFLFLSKFYNPLVIMLFILAIFSLFFGEKISAFIIILMALLSAIVSFFQEHSASQNAKKLREMVKISASVLRDGKKLELALSEILPGDVIELSAGKLIPADLRIFYCKDFFVNQSALNGESFPVRKNINQNDTDSDVIFNFENLVFMGSSVASGVAQGVVIRTGLKTEFGQLSKEISTVKIETGFDKGIKSFTWLMIRLIFVLTLTILLINLVFKSNPIEALLFALAVAIGLAPEMLPMIVTVNLSRGAIDMAKKKVIVKELASIQNFGAMDVLCCDKTGTLTIDDITLVQYTDINGDKDEHILKYAYYNSFFQTGLENLLDTAVKNYKKFDVSTINKVDEIPYDFDRRLMSVVIKENNQNLLITKGAPEEVFKKCVQYQLKDKNINIDNKILAELKKQYEDLSLQVFRVLAVGCKNLENENNYSKNDETNLIFIGFISFFDPPRPESARAIEKLLNLGIRFKVLTGDNELVTKKICQEVNIISSQIMTGKEIDELSDEDLKEKVETLSIFARLDPAQKQRIVKMLQANNHIVGFLGDGINDAPSIKQADVGISVNNATDIAKETANIILLERDLDILADCVLEGRRTFDNTAKYIKMGASSNFGNMISMTGASLFLPFLPMLPTQILLNNFLYDLSQVAIPTDDVDQEDVSKPRPWNINFIKKFIIYFGPISSIFDFVTFWVMFKVFHAPQELFQTGWFVESLCTQVLVIYVIRTNKIPFFQSRPSKILFISTISIVLFGCLIPYLPFAKFFGFVPLPFNFFGILLLIALIYLFLTQIIKTLFIKKFGY